MKKTNYFFAIIIAFMSILSCRTMISETKESAKYKTETIQGENIELRNQLRGKRHRVRDRQRNGYKGRRFYINHKYLNGEF